MRVKEQWRIKMFRDAAKAMKQGEGGPSCIIRLPIAMGDDKHCLASVYPYDGRALVVPATLRCGILVVEWCRFMRFARRHNLI